MYCRQCGKDVALGAQFCSGCGAPIGKTKAAPRATLRISPKVWVALGALAGIALLVVGGMVALDKWQEWSADQLFAEAQQLVQQGHEAEKGSYAEAEGAQEPRVNRPSSYLAALKHYEQALKTTRQLTQEYPATVAARKFAEHDVRLGPYAVSELEKTLIPKMREKALIFAVTGGDVEAVRNLLQNAVDPNVDNGVPLYTAAQLGHAKIVGQLIEAGAELNMKIPDGHTLDCYTPLSESLARGYQEVVNLLVAAGARVDYQSSDYPKGGYGQNECNPSATTFVAAAEGGASDIVKRMLAAGAPVDTGAGYKQATTALMAAAANGHVETVQVLVSAGADLDRKDTELGTALGRALVNGRADVVDVLTKGGARNVQAQYQSPTKWITIDDKEPIAALRQETAKVTIRNLQEHLTSYRQDVGQYPTTAEGLKALLQRPPDALNWSGPCVYKYRTPQDPWGHEYHYESPGEHGDYDLYSLGADNAEGGDGEKADIGSWKEVDTSVQEHPAPTQSTEESTTAAQDLEGSNGPSSTAPTGAPKVQVGDTYIVESAYRSGPTLNSTTERRVSSVSDDRIDVVSKNIQSKSGKERILQFTLEWNLVASRNSDGTGMDFSPALKYFDFPLYPGKTWKQTTVERNSKTGSIREFTLSATVGNWEDVSVPAGVFRAIKITTQTELLDREKGQQSTGTDVSWYAPNLRRSAKSVVTSRNIQGQAEEQVIQVVRYDLK